MKLHRFYVEIPLNIGKIVTVLDEERINQWFNVFRLGGEDKVILFNGNGKEYEAEFTELHKKKAVLNIVNETVSLSPLKPIHLYMSVIKKDLFELVVQKVTELGISSVTPIITEKSVVKNLSLDRLNKIAIEASEQCGRGDIPKINKTVSLSEVLKNIEGEIIVCNKGGENIKNLITEDKINLFIGPEGGWGEKDLEIFNKYKVKYISLGSTTLRSETAAIVASAFLID